MKLIPILAAAASICAATPAFSALVTVDFDNLASQVVTNQYPNINFSNSVTVTSDPAFFEFTGNPSGLSVMVVNAAEGATSVMNVTTGFVGNASFSFSNISGATGTVSVFSGLNATGSTLASFTLAANDNLNQWYQLSQDFVGTAYSISFAGNDGNIAYDNVTVNAVPLPAALLLFPFGAAGLGLTARRKRKV
ncbi:MAG: VPLPA-CTERM sorting domain-containing protein [Pseudomonadota bacterium]|nr:VPLPA-CTERM sorting domain-containing protein [Pseudomonadota bacterium]